MKNNMKKIMAGSMAFVMATGLAGTYGYQQSISEVKAEDEEAETLEEEAKEILSDHSEEDTEEAFKEESVYVKADPSGNVTTTTVTEWLKNPGMGTFIDVTSLKDVKNIKGDEEFAKGDGDEINWQAEGNDIYYQGTADQELPVDVKISYKLDGKDISAGDLEGKDGKVEIHIEYENKSKETVDVNGKMVEMYTPFTMVTAMMLSTDEYSNIAIDNGKIMSDADKNIVVGLGFPGLSENLDLDDADLDIDIPESVTITADVKDASVGMTVTVASSEIMEEFDLSDVKNFDDLKDSIEQLEDVADQLVDGTKEAADGSKELADGSKTLADGTKTLADGSKTLADGSKELADGVNTLNDKSGELIGGVNTLAEGVNKYTSSVSALADGSASVAAGADTLKDGTAQIQAGVQSAKAGADAIAAGYEGEQGALAGAQNLADALEQLNNTVAANGGSGITSDQIAAIASQTAVGTMAEIGPNNELSEEQRQAIIGAYTAGFQQVLSSLVSQVDAGIASSSEQLQAGIGQIQAGANQLAGGMQQLYVGTKELQSGLGELTDGSAVLAQGTSELSSGAAAVANGAAALNESSSLLTIGTSKLKEGGSQLASGVSQLANGAGQVSDGASTLADGSHQLVDGSQQLADGSRQLADGNQQLADGMSEFKTEGIDKLTEIFDGDIQNVTSRIDAMSTLGKNYKSFAGIKNGMNGSTKFIIETVGVEEK